jgi:hypothetical protein
LGRGTGFVSPHPKKAAAALSKFALAASVVLRARLASAMSRLYMRCVTATQYAEVFFRIWALALPEEEPEVAAPAGVGCMPVLK